ncbi:MAG: lysophospholipid acyltransferase family protein [Bacteroidia bacterium]
MIIKAKPLHPFFFWWGALFVGLFLRSRFNRIKINAIPIKADHSCVLMCNHFSFLDGFLVYYLAAKLFKNKKLHIMVMKRQMEKNWWLKYIGCFSIDPGKRSIEETFEYTAALLSKPENLVVIYPQGNMESNYIRHIQFGDGLNQIVPKVEGNCQLVWSSNLMEYFESTKPSLFYNLLDCGTSTAYDFESLKQKVNQHHRASIEKNFRFTEER